NGRDPRGILLEHPVSEYTIEETDFGLRLVAVRQPEPGAAYVRVSSIVLPTDCWIPGATKSVHFYVPVDDGASWRFNLNFREDGPLDKSRLSGAIEPWYGPDYRKLRNIHNHYLIDREKQKTENFTGLGLNFIIHDAMATETMGPIFDRSREHLGVSDKAVIAMRRYLLDVLDAFQNGGEPPNLVYAESDNTYQHVDTFGETIAGTNWRAAFPHLTRSRRETGAVAAARA